MPNDRFARPPFPRRRAWLMLLASALVASCAIVAGPAMSPASPPAPRPAAASPVISPTLASARPAISPTVAAAHPQMPSLAPSPSPPASVTALPPTPASATPLPPTPSPAAPFAMDLFRRADFVSQARSDWCVPASILMMARLIDPAAARLMPGQQTLDRQARALSSSRLVGAGSEPQGWAGVLNRHGFGRYQVAAFRTRAAALKAAARAIRSTGRPVGLLMWHGAHAWVMSGFRATADPALTRAFRVTGVRVSDPWYPRTASAFGRTRRPDVRLNVSQLSTGFLRWHRPLARYAELDGRFVVVIPVPGRGG